MKACEEAETVVGIINGKVKGGFTVRQRYRAFLPGSLVDVRPIRDTAHPRKQRARVQSNQARPGHENNVVVSRRCYRI